MYQQENRQLKRLYQCSNYGNGSGGDVAPYSSFAIPLNADK